MAVKLREHQIEAVAAIVRGLDIPPGGIPWNGLRGQVHAACGTGKTIMAGSLPQSGLCPRAEFSWWC